MAGNKEEDEIYAKHLIRVAVERERRRDGIRCTTDDQMLIARSQAIDWFFTMKPRLGIGYPTVFMAVMNLDRYLAKGPTGTSKNWVFRLICIVCLSLAVSEYEKDPIHDLLPKLNEDYSFALSDIVKIGRLVYFALQSHFPVVNPFDFISPLATLFSHESAKEQHITLTQEILVAAVTDTSIMEHRSYNIAMAVTFIVLDPTMSPNALAMKLNDAWVDNPFELDDVCMCYDHMKELLPVKEHISVSQKPETNPDVKPVITQGRDGPDLAPSSSRRDG